MTFVSYAQNFEDVLLWRSFRDVEHGFYIDVGAMHPDTDSVTRAFYDRGWSGINIEPVSAHHRRLNAARPRDINLEVAVGQQPGRLTLYIIEETGLSTGDETIAATHREADFTTREQDVEVATVADLCRQYAPATIHFMKIDVEGMERQALSGADFASYRPIVVVVEATWPNSTVESHAEWEPILLAGYRYLWFDGLNRFYAAGEHYESVAPHFRIPVSSWDDFVRAAD